MKRFAILTILALLAFLWFQSRRQEPAHVTTPRPRAAETSRPPARVGIKPSEPEERAPRVETVAPEPEEPEVVTEPEKKSKKFTLPYKLRNGLMIVQGDWVAGAPTRPDVPDEGFVILQPIKLWAHGTIPYHIQPTVPNPERVVQALAMFQGTPIHFTPYNGEEDALVFDVGDKDCLSYVGKMGGKQPIWLSDGCRPEDIAHEILHALGFVHEQNRSDRDAYVEVHPENIEEENMVNFEKLGAEFMRVSGLGAFDFQSLMIYPPWMFAKNGHSTMNARQRDKLIQPSSRLSAGDLDRLGKAYAK